jgi:hypothetical protein
MSNSSENSSFTFNSTAAMSTITSTISTLIKTTLENIELSTTSEDYAIIDDSFYGPNFVVYSNTPKVSEMSPLLIIFLFLAILAIITFNIFYMIKNRKLTIHRSASYQILVHYLVFKTLFCLVEFFNIFSSSALNESIFYIRPTNFSCVFTRISSFYFEVCQNFQLLLLWVILLSERSMLGYKYLNSDFELKRALLMIQQTTSVANGNTENATIDSNNTSTTSPTANTNPNEPTAEQRLAADIVKDLGSVSPKNILKLNSRHILLFLFYLIVFMISFYPKRRFFVRDLYRGGTQCFMYPHFDGLFVVIIVAFIFLFFLPIFYWLMALSTVFSKSFGGERDPILKRLGEADIFHLKFIKTATIVKFLEQFFLHIIATHDIHVSKSLYTTSRIIGLTLILLVNILFMFYENVFSSVRRRIASLFTNQRINYRAFRNRGVYQETVDYRNLVETT